MYRPSGREDSVQPGDFIGLANYLDKHDYTSTARATTKSSLLVTSEETLHRLEQEQQDLFNALNRVIASKLRERSPDRSITSGALARPVYQIMKSPVAGWFSASPAVAAVTSRSTFESCRDGPAKRCASPGYDSPPAGA